MIRFSCDTCGRALRAPASMAGKRGKCARCGGINRVPEVLSVDVKRAPEASPFRNADAPARGAIVGTVDLAEGKFLSTPVEAPPKREATSIYEQVTGTWVDQETDPRPRREDDPPPYAQPGSGTPMHPMDGLAPPVPDYEFQLDLRSEMSRAIAASLVVGAVLGFCAGLLASKWIM
jgi:hypothetical protein